MTRKELLYKQLGALRLEVHSSIVDAMVTTANEAFKEQWESEDKPLLQWVRVEDELPKRGMRVLAWDGINIRLLPTDVAIQTLPSDVTHWMPLPEPPLQQVKQKIESL